MTERLDKLIASQGKLSRSEVKKAIKEGRITIDGERAKSSDIKLDPQKVKIALDGKELFYKKHVYFMLNKPKGVISASNDKSQTTVVDLIKKEDFRQGLFPAGRLDGDTTGFVLITDDGDFAHRILSPKNHIMKTYEAKIKRPLTQEEIESFKKGITLADGTECLEAEVKMLEEGEKNLARIRICEGKYHQVKRMFAAMDNRVLELKRTKMGAVSLDDALGEGEYRELSEKELASIELKETE